MKCMVNYYNDFIKSLYKIMKLYIVSVNRTKERYLYGLMGEITASDCK